MHIRRMIGRLKRAPGAPQWAVSRDLARRVPLLGEQREAGFTDAEIVEAVEESRDWLVGRAQRTNPMVTLLYALLGGTVGTFIGMLIGDIRAGRPGQ